jgi:hypothetical protein
MLIFSFSLIVIEFSQSPISSSGGDATLCHPTTLCSTVNFFWFNFFRNEFFFENFAKKYLWHLYDFYIFNNLSWTFGFHYNSIWHFFALPPRFFLIFDSKILRVLLTTRNLDRGLWTMGYGMQIFFVYFSSFFVYILILPPLFF